MITGSDTIEAVQSFLLDRVLPHVPADLRGDLRAAVKNLGDAAVQLREQPGVESDDVRELLAELEHTARQFPALGDEASVQDLAARLASPAEDSADVQRELLAEVDRVVLLLQGDDSVAGTQALARWYRLLHRRSAPRASWQSVFDPAADPVVLDHHPDSPAKERS